MRHVTPSPPPSVSFAFWLFGGMRVVRGGHPVAIPGGKTLHLLTYLLLQAEPDPARSALLTRDMVIDQLWPDMPVSRGRRTLSDTLYRLRGALGNDWLYVKGENLALAPENHIWVDLWSFENLVKSQDTRDLEMAIDLYTGDLVPEIYEDWLLTRRISLQEAHQAALLHLAEDHENHQRHQQAHTLYTQLVALDPLREEAQRGVMRSLARMERLPEALARYEQLVEQLDSELAVPPSAETKRLADLLQRELEQARAASSHPARPLFVGRVEERARLVSRLDLARSGQGGLIVVMGEAGIGKSAMLAEMAQAAAWRNWQTYWGTHPVQTVPGPYSPLDRGLRAALPTPRLQQLAHMVSPARLAPATVLAPAIRRTLPPQAAVDIRATSDEVAAATQQILQALQRIAPHLFLLEDCAAASNDFWYLLDQVAPALAHMRLLLVLSARTDDVRSHASAWSLITKWDRIGRATIIDLQGLSTPDLQALLVAHGASQPDDQEIARLHRASRGNPLIALATWEAGIRSEQPFTVEDLAQRRVAALTQPAQKALACAAVLGTAIEYPIWHAMWTHLLDRPEGPLPADDANILPEPDSLPTLAGELEANRLLYIHEDRYHFAHETLRVAAIDVLSRTEQRQWHAAALAAVEQSKPEDAARLFHHAIASALPSAIARHGVAAGQEALSRFDYPNAIHFFSQALDALPANQAEATHNPALQGAEQDASGHPLALEYSARLGRSEAYGILAKSTEQELDLHSLQELAARLEDVHYRIEVCYRTAHFYWRTGRLEQAQAIAEQGLALAETSPDGVDGTNQESVSAQERKAALLEVLGRITRDRKEPARAYIYVEQAHSIYQALKNRWGQALTLDILGGLAWDAGEYTTAAERHQAAADLFQAEGDLVREAQALNNLGSTYWALGAYGQARATHERSLAACRAAGNRRSEADNIDNLGGVAWVLGDYDTAIEYYEDALSIRRAIDDTWGVAISLGNLGSAYRLRGDLEKALAYYDQSLPLYRKVGRRRSEAYVMHNRGATRLAMADVPAAMVELQAALEIRREIGDRNSMAETQAQLAIAHLEQKDLDAATDLIETALSTLQPESAPASLRREIHFHAYLVYQRVNEQRGAVRNSETEAHALRHLGLAQQALDELCAPLSDEDCRRLRASVPLNRRLLEALDAHARSTRVRLARIDAPLGRKLTDHETTEVSWTIYTARDCLLEDEIERRRTVLQRLAAEAQEQGALPTDNDLAQALGVSRRTILRDIEALEAQNVSIATRTRK